ncbi:MAG: hypothetical protein LBH00_04670 [Planctomycetaceae bacterium]|jgi:transposase|nr:hypothetical protein [Planctomycetaceae bacterium]
MAKSYSMDLRARAMNDIHSGHSERKTAEKFGVSRPMDSTTQTAGKTNRLF